MGCGGSKVDDLPLVTLCRERKEFMRAAAQHRYELSASHLTYFHSLRDVGIALCRFVDEELAIPSPTPSSPVLTLPSDQGKKSGSSHSNRKPSNPKSKTAPSSSSTSISHLHSIDVGDMQGNPHLDLSSDTDSDSGSGPGHIHIQDDAPLPHSRQPPFYPYDQTAWNPPYPMDLPQQQRGWAPYGMNLSSGGGPGPYIEPGLRDYVEVGNFYPGGGYGGNPNLYGYEGNGNSYGYGYEGDLNSYGYGGNPNSYGYGGNSNSNAYYMKKSAPAMRTVIHEEEAHGYQEVGTWLNAPQNNESGGFFGFSMGGGPPQEPRQPNRSPAPPPPPSPKVSSWDFFNPFDGFDNGYQSYYRNDAYGYTSVASSPDSNEVREREGIPDLEEETENEFFPKQAPKLNTNGNRRNSGEDMSREVPQQKSATHPWEETSHSSEGSSRRMPDEMREGHSRASPSEASGMDMPSGSSEGPVKATPWHSGEEAKSVNLKEENSSADTITSESIDVEFVSKKGVSYVVDETSMQEDKSSKISSLTTLSAHGSRDLHEVVDEIKDEFETAFTHGKEVAVMLESDKLPYQHRFAVLKAALSRILPLIAPSSSLQSVRSHSRMMKLARSYLDSEKGKNLKPSHLSSTLDELYVWEKKLYKEVKDEEKLRVVYEKMCKRLKVLDERGAESSKIDAVQASIRRLLTRLNVCIKAIDAIASRIQKLRDDVLQPQVNELIHGLIRMWKSMAKCHKKQFQAIMDSKTPTLKAKTVFRKDSSLSATLELEIGLLAWRSHFLDWIKAQKSYVDSLNKWLSRCLHYVPEITVDGEIPFSPGRIGAPAIFVICNDWQQGMDSISEESVSNKIHNFALNLRKLLERQEEEQRHRLRAEYLAKDYAKRRKALKMERGKTGHGHEAMPDKTGASIVASESGVSLQDDLKVNLDSMRKRVDEELARYMDAVKLVDDVASSSLHGGVLPIFKALENFASDALTAHEQVRLQSSGQPPPYTKQKN